MYTSILLVIAKLLLISGAIKYHNYFLLQNRLFFYLDAIINLCQIYIICAQKRIK